MSFTEFVLIVVVILHQIALGLIRKRLNRLEAAQKPKATAKSLKFFILVDGQKKEVTKMNIQDDVGTKAFALEADDALDNAGASLASVPQWSSTDPSVATVVASDDGLSATATITGKLGIFRLHVLVKGTAGDGSDDLVGESEDLNVVAGRATKLVIKPV